MRRTRPSLAGAVAAIRAAGSSRRSAGFAARCAPALAAGLALAALAVFQADRASAAETAFLALWVTAALLPAAVLAPSAGWEALLGAPLAVLAGWTLPAGPARLAAVGVLLVAVFAVSAGRSVVRTRVATLAPHGSVLLPLALGAQILLRSDLLLAPDARAAVLLIVPPLAGAWALSRLVSLAGLPAALIAGGAAVTLGPGFTSETTLALLGVAGGAEIAAWVAGRRPSWIALVPPIAGLAVGLALETRAMVAALLAGNLLVLAARDRRAARARARKLDEPSCDRGGREGLRERLEGAAPVATYSLAGALSLLLIAGALALGAPSGGLSLRSPSEAFGLLAWLAVLVPVLVQVVPAATNRWAPGLAALALGWFSTFVVPGPAAPVAAIAVLALLAAAPPGAAALGERVAGVAGGAARPVRRPVLAAQGVWTGALLAATALLASPPWLRPRPADEALALIGLEPGWLAAGAVVAATLVLAAIGASPVRRLVRRPAAPAGGLLIVVLLLALPRTGRAVHEGPAVVLSSERPRMAVDLPGRPPAAVAVYTHLSNGFELASGTEVATLALVDQGRTIARRSLRAGLDTGEWAVRRPDVAALPGIEAPPPWAVWIEPGGGPDGSPQGSFFGQYYRALLELVPPRVIASSGGASPVAAADRRSSAGGEEGGSGGAVRDDGAANGPVAATKEEGTARVVVERASGLPDEVLLTVHRIEVAG